MARLKKLKFNNTSYEFPVEDVKLNTTSVVTDGVASIPVDSTVTASSTNLITSGAVSSAIGNITTDVNTKTFYLSSTSDLTNAQAAYDWYAAGKNPIIIFNEGVYLESYEFRGTLYFKSLGISSQNNANTTSYITHTWLEITYSNNTVTTITQTNNNISGNYLKTDTNYSTPYTPQYDGSPATKKYVDDIASGKQDTLVSGTNIKTVNGNSLLGNGDIEISAGEEYYAGEGINISQDNVISADISSADGNDYKITKVKKLPTVIDASTIYFVSTPKPFGDTITISWTETSDPAQFNPIWSDGAADAEAGDERFDNWFGYSGVKLSSTGTETATASQKDGVLNITQLGTLTSGDNVMIKFPVRGIKMSKSGNVVTLSMTKELNKSGYQYYAFNRDGTAVDKFYVGAFKGTSNSSKLRSRATNAKPTVSRSITDFRNTDVITGYGSSSHYSLITWPIRNYINALYMMKYGNPDSQSVIGGGYTGGSTAQVLGTTVTGISGNLATGATNTSSTGRIRLFGLEDWWGNINEWVDGVYGNYVNMTNNPLKLKELGDTSYGWESLGSATSMDGNITSIVGDDKGMFFPSACSGGGYTTYYCNRGYVSASSVAHAGGNWGNTSSAGAFRLNVNCSATFTDTGIGARLAYI